MHYSIEKSAEREKEVAKIFDWFEEQLSLLCREIITLDRMLVFARGLRGMCGPWDGLFTYFMDQIQFTLPRQRGDHLYNFFVGLSMESKTSEKEAFLENMSGYGYTRRRALYDRSLRYEHRPGFWGNLLRLGFVRSPCKTILFHFDSSDYWKVSYFNSLYGEGEEIQISKTTTLDEKANLLDLSKSRSIEVETLQVKMKCAPDPEFFEDIQSLSPLDFPLFKIAYPLLESEFSEYVQGCSHCQRITQSTFVSLSIPSLLDTRFCLECVHIALSEMSFPLLRSGNVWFVEKAGRLVQPSNHLLSANPEFRSFAKKKGWVEQ